MTEQYLKFRLPPSPVEKLLAKDAASGNPIRFEKGNQSVAKKKKVGANADLSSTAPDVKVDKVKRRPRSTGVKKTSSKKSNSARKTKSAAAIADVDPTDDEIRVRAYFISERRRRFDLPGDASSDWLEAKRQLLSEIGPR